MIIYLLKYPDGKWVYRDDSSGPMSTGGYPFRVDTIKRATFWYDKEAAIKYAHVCRSDNFTLWQFDVDPERSNISIAERAKATEDKEYLEYLRLDKKYNSVIEECPFIMAWVGRCKEDSEPGETYCHNHLEKKCFKCSRQATRDCGHTSQFVCGAPSCDEHQHHVDG